MNTAVNANVVRESEAQRQHARVKIPAKLRFFGPDRTPLETRVLDLSAGGLAFNAGQMPLTIGVVSQLVRADTFAWGQIMAGALMAALPPVIIYAFLMDYYIAGLTAGATKG